MTNVDPSQSRLHKLLLSLSCASLMTVACGRAVPAASTPKPPVSTAHLVCPAARVQTDHELRALEGCSQIRGDLIVSGASIASLRSLAQLTKVRGRLDISHNGHLRSLEGLERLTDVDHLSVRNNYWLSDVSALEGLQRASTIAIEETPALEQAPGFESIRALDALTIRATGLSTLDGFGNLRQVLRLTVADNRRLISLRALSGVDQAESIEIRNNPLLYCGSEEFLPRLTWAKEVVLVDNGVMSARDAEAFSQRLTSGSGPDPVLYAGR